MIAQPCRTTHVRRARTAARVLAQFSNPRRTAVLALSARAPCRIVALLLVAECSCRLPPACFAPPRPPADAQALAARFALPLLSARPAAGYWLELDEARLSLLNPDKHGPVYAEFVEGAAAHRRQFMAAAASRWPRPSA